MAAPGQQLTDPDWLMVSSTVAGGKRADLSVAGVQGLVPGPHLSGQGNQATPRPDLAGALPLPCGAWVSSSPPPRPGPGQIPQGAWAGGPQGAEPSLLDTAGPVLLHVPAGAQGPSGRASRGAPAPEAVWGRVLRKMSQGSAGAKAPRPPRVPLYSGTELCQAPRLPAALGLWWGLKVRLHNARRVGAGGRGCVRRRDKSPAFPPSFLVVPGLTSPRRKKDRDGTL